MERGEVWWALIDGRRPVVLLSGERSDGFLAMQIVAPASAEERHGFLLLSGEEAASGTGEAQIAAAGSDVRGVGVEVHIGAGEGLTPEGVVRVALPRGGHIFCTWLVTLTREYLIDRAGVLPPGKQRQLDDALRLAGIE